MQFLTHSSFHLHQKCREVERQQRRGKSTWAIFKLKLLYTSDIWKNKIMCHQVTILQIWTCVQQSFLIPFHIICLNTGTCIHIFYLLLKQKSLSSIDLILSRALKQSGIQVILIFNTNHTWTASGSTLNKINRWAKHINVHQYMFDHTLATAQALLSNLYYLSDVL